MKSSSILVSVLPACLFLLLAGCCHYPMSHIKAAHGRPAAPSITIVAYGDTRTGPWGLGDNEKQAVQGKVVDDVFKNDGPIDAVIFTGDAVMSNFVVWKKDYWRCFLTQSNRFRSQDIPFYPSLGNHEVLPAIVPLIRTSDPVSTMVNPQSIREEPDRLRRVAQAYDAGESPKVSTQALEAAPKTAIDTNTAAGRGQVKKWGRDTSSQDINTATDGANKLGQFQRQMQGAFYGQSFDDRCSGDAQTFSDDYLGLAKYQYLDPLLNKRSYYSVEIDKNGIHLLLIALDTNCLGSRPQQEFFVKAVKEFIAKFDGPIIVFGHHPPVNYDYQTSWPWDSVKGWEFFRDYLTNADSTKLVLWVFGHVHDYQRRDSSAKEKECKQPPPAQPPVLQPPVLLVAGGGGASLDDGAAPFQWQPATWPDPFVCSAYHQIKITVTATNMVVDVRGAKGMNEDFHQIDSFTISLR